MYAGMQLYSMHSYVPAIIIISFLYKVGSEY